MTQRLILLAFLALATTAAAQTLHGVTDSLSGGGSPIPPVDPCAGGNINLTNGCVQPMLR